ncbi:MAG: ATP-dependent DNA ligase, partial [Polyangiaceae bacterium]|nr:ATP-dependent DNA ligase [Polyangiaceae bacterium]
MTPLFGRMLHEMRLEEIVAASTGVASTRKRSEKVARIASVLARARPEDAAIAASYLAGVLPRGKPGIGAAALVAAAAAPAPSASLELAEVERDIAAVAACTGKGSRVERDHRLGLLLSRATAD